MRRMMWFFALPRSALPDIRHAGAQTGRAARKEDQRTKGFLYPAYRLAWRWRAMFHTSPQVAHRQ